MKPYYTNETFRFTDKGNNANERSNFDGYYKEQINLYGQEVEYFVYNYSTSGHDMVYGEHPTGSYHNAIKTVMLLTLNEGSIPNVFFFRHSGSSPTIVSVTNRGGHGLISLQQMFFFS